MKFFINILMSLFILIFISACGGGGGGNSTTPPPTAASAILDFDIKTFRFTWTDVADTTFYRLLENPDGISGFSQVGNNIAQGTQTVDHIVPLYKRINASYILQSCNSGGCTDSEILNVSSTLAEAIGYFKASNTGMSDQFGFSLSLSADGSTLAVGAANEDGSGAAYVFIRGDSGWFEQAYIKASNLGVGDLFGFSISLSADGNTLAVGAKFEDSSTTDINNTPSNDDAADAGAVYVFSRSDSSWSEQAYIKASNTVAGDWFGSSVILSPDGNTLAVGANAKDNKAGAVYVFSRSVDTWSEQDFLKASNAGSKDEFGRSLSLSADGNTLAVGASLEDGGAVDAGAVYVFSRSVDTHTWTEQDYLKASNAGSKDEFGRSVSLSADGNTLAVGASLEDSVAVNAGAVYVFSRSVDTWSEQGYLKASNAGADDEFGISVSLSADGNTLAVGANFEDSDTTGINTAFNDFAPDAGAAYVFSRSVDTWSEQAYIKASNTGISDKFGIAISLSADGNTLAAGASGEASNSVGINSTPNDFAFNAGAVYVY